MGTMQTPIIGLPFCDHCQRSYEDRYKHSEDRYHFQTCFLPPSAHLSSIPGAAMVKSFHGVQLSPLP